MLMCNDIYQCEQPEIVVLSDAAESLKLQCFIARP